MGNYYSLLILLLGIYNVAGQPREIFPLSPSEMRRLRLVHNPELLEVAARANEEVFLRYRDAEMTVIVQENVNVYFDCNPWASNFPGGSIRWYIRALQLDPNQGLIQRSPFGPVEENTTRIFIGGVPPLQRWLNITGTIATEAAQDPDFGDYRCEVCIDRDRFPNNFGDNCHNSTTRLFIAGAPPDVLEGDDTLETTPITADRFSNTIQVGGDFCVDEAESDDYTISCNIGNTPQPVPANIRTQWLKDGQTVAAFDSDGERVINSSFYSLGSGNEVFNPMSINPGVLSIGSTNGIVVNTMAENVTMMAAGIPSNLSSPDIRRRIVNSLLGNWTCSASNVYGSDSESTIIRRCEGRPTFPGCEGGATAIFPMSGSVVPIGCTICIPRGSSITIDCNAMTPSNMLTYTWLMDGTNISTTSRRLRVTEEASYTCRAVNLDFPNEMETSVLVYSIALDFNAKITSSAGAQVAGNGCDRLREMVNNTDLCVLIGDQVDISCINTETRAQMNYSNANMDIFASGPRMVSDTSFESNYTCRIATPDECGRVGRRLNVRVFDPARIDRSATEPAESLGVGQFTSVQRPVLGDPLTLSCQTNGINDPTTGWFFVNTSSGCGMEVPITDGVTTTEQGDSTLAIGAFGSSNDGTYICRTDNIAGRDAASIVLSSAPDVTRWVPDTEFGECSVMCRDGVMSRSVSCRNSPGGRLRPNSQCTGNRPTVTQTCQDLFPNECLLTPIFGFKPFGECPLSCGGGFREREVFCFIPMTREVVDDNRCRETGLPEPARIESCPDRCCKEDGHLACRRMTNLDTMCSIASIQKLCCWTCRKFAGLENFPRDDVIRGS